MITSLLIASVVSSTIALGDNISEIKMPVETARVAIVQQETQQTQTEENEYITPTNMFAEGTQMHFMYDIRKANGKQTGAWGGPETWLQAAEKSGIEVGIEPRVNATCVVDKMLFNVKEIKDGQVYLEGFYIKEKVVPVRSNCIYIY